MTDHIKLQHLALADALEPVLRKAHEDSRGGTFQSFVTRLRYDTKHELHLVADRFHSAMIVVQNPEHVT